MNQLTVFEQREVLGKEFKMYGTPDQPLFLAKDVAEWIEHTNPAVMLSKVDEEEKELIVCDINNVYTTSKARKTQESWFLTEYGLYEVLMQSRKPIAKEFRKEVKSILKQIRMTGGYVPVVEEETNEEFLARAFMIAQQTLAKKDELLKQKEELLLEQKPKVEYYETVLQSKKLSTTTMVAKDLGMTATKLNEKLHELGIIYKQSNTWFFYADYQFLLGEYADYHITQYGQTLKWTEKGRKYIIELLT